MILDADEIVLLTCCCYIMYMMNSGDDMNTRVELSSVGVSKSEDKMNTGIVTSNVGINKSEDRMNIGVDVSSVGVSKSEDKVNIKIEDKVNIGIESNNTELNSNKNERGGCWEHNFSVEFPIIYGNVKNGVVSVDVDSPHAGYMIRGKLLNGVLNGKCELLNRNCKVIGSFNFVDGIVNGVCRINDENGILFFEGNMKNGYREGYGIEYDLNGNVIYEGLYKQGKRMNVVAMKEMKGYWKEMNEEGELISICHKNKKYENDGICYFYVNGAINKVSEYKNGEEVNVLKRFEGKKMIEFVNGVKRYEGEYRDSMTDGYIREGNGKEYDVKGKNVIYEGEFWNGKRQEQEKLNHKGNGMYNRHGLNITIWIIIIISIIMITFLCVFFFEMGIILLVVDVVIYGIVGICYFSMLCYRKKHNRKDLRIENRNVNDKICNYLMYCFYGVFVLSVIFTVISGVIQYTALKKCVVSSDSSFYIESNSCNHFYVSSFIPNSDIELIEIGDNCYKNVGEFVINGLNRLKSLKIGESSFTQHINGYNRGSPLLFSIVNCNELESIEIGRYSFNVYGYWENGDEFELRNLPSLYSLKIGEIGSESGNFRRCSFMIEGIIDMILLMNRSSTFEFH